MLSSLVEKPPIQACGCRKSIERTSREQVIEQFQKGTVRDHYSTFRDLQKNKSSQLCKKTS